MKVQHIGILKSLQLLFKGYIHFDCLRNLIRNKFFHWQTYSSVQIMKQDRVSTSHYD